MNSGTSEGTLTVDLHVRSLAPGPGQSQQERVIERLDDLETGGYVDEFTVNVWGRQVSLSSAVARTDAGQFVLDRVEEFREWAAGTDRSIDSFFETRRVESSITDQEYAALVLPALTLAEYRDGDLAYVAPCTDGETVVTVEDRLDTLERNRVTEVVGTEETEAPLASDQLPK